MAEDTADLPRSSSPLEQAPGNTEDLDQYTSQPHIKLDNSPMPQRRSKAKRLAHESLNFGIDFHSAAVDEARKAYQEASQVVSQHLALRRRRKICQRADAKDIAIEPSTKPEITGRNELKSSLLKLPLELRLQIYECICSPPATIAIRYDPNTFRLKACMEQYDLHAASCQLKTTSCSCFVRRVAFNLPLTCRQLYFETIQYLYSTNTFRFYDTRLILSLHNTIPLKHLRQITSLHLFFEVDDLLSAYHLPQSLQKTHLIPHSARSALQHRQSYTQFWHFVRTNMTNLRSLVILLHRINGTDHNMEQNICEWLLRPLIQWSEDEKRSLWSSNLTFFEVQVGVFWFLDDISADIGSDDFMKGFEKRVAPRKAPFVLTREHA